ncbi:hypothetical protein ACMGD3_24865 [Lysinibacillus sphaericus]|uniref:hypothetical protein n=1 Tax=Lysinibacillus sphaericus TaxID=1421 RepID=UPI003F79115A
MVLLIVGAVLLLLHFKASLIPDEKEEAKVISQAEQYLREIYPTMEYKITHVLYDRDNQYDSFVYAAVILNIETQHTFMVYENSYTEQMEDDITIQEETNFIEQVRPKVFSYITETFGEPQGMAFTPSYALGGTPTLTIRLNNKKEEINEEMFQSFIDYLQHELNVEQAHVNIMYDNEIWDKEF